MTTGDRLRLVLLAVLLLPNLLLAAPPAEDADALPPGSLVRYFDEQGKVVITSTLPREAIDQGYDLLDSRGRVLRSVEPALSREERRKALAKQQARAEDQDLTRLYPTPQDAERARDRLITALRLKIDYARSAIIQLDDKLSAEVETAAQAEQAGRAVSEAVAANIEIYSKQIREQEEKIADAKKDIAATRQEFAPIIERLRGINGGQPTADQGDDETGSAAEQAGSNQ